jgi:hypothetical protein
MASVSLPRNVAKSHTVVKGIIPISLTITILILCFTPALGKVGHVGADPMNTLLALRHGKMPFLIMLRHK